MIAFRLLRLKLNDLEIVLSHMQLELIRSFKLIFFIILYPLIAYFEYVS
jgi:hypothetical protein